MPPHRRPPRHLHASELPAVVLPAVAVALVIAIGFVSFALADQLGGGRGAQAAPPSADPAPSVSPPAPSPRTWTAIENDKPGTSDWVLDAGGGHPSTKGEIEGYANAVSGQRGDTVQLYVSTTAPSWTVTAFRTGWYQGKLARLVWSSTVRPGLVQPSATRDPATNMVEANWASSMKVTIDETWPPGDYLLKLRATSGAASYIPLTVRDDDSHAPILINNSVTTWQAYNRWDGYSLYAGPSGAASRSDVVSFDRPYGLDNGAGDFLGNEQKFVKLVEREGVDVSYTTDVDLQAHPERLVQHRALVSLGHDEYWSTGMRQATEVARDHGVNLVFLGANAVYRHIRLEPSALGLYRHEVNYRSAAADPLTGVDNAEVTVQWRDPPVRRPENTLLGEMYECNPVKADLIVTQPDAWVYAGSGLTTGARLPGLVGSEYDHWSPGPGAIPVDLISRSPVVCRGHASTSDFTYYVAPSGAGVIDTGTNLWVPKILDDPSVGSVVARITMTILQEAARGPLGRNHPQIATPTSDTTAGPPPPPGE